MAEKNGMGCFARIILAVVGFGFACKFQGITLIACFVVFTVSVGLRLLHLKPKKVQEVQTVLEAEEERKVEEAKPQNIARTGARTGAWAWAILLAVVAGISLLLETGQEQHAKVATQNADRSTLDSAKTLLSQGKPIEAQTLLKDVSGGGAFEQERTELTALAIQAIKDTYFGLLVKHVAGKEWEKAGAAFDTLTIKLSPQEETPESARDAMTQLSKHYRDEKNWKKAHSVLKRIAKTDEEKAGIQDLEAKIEQERVAVMTQKNLDELQSFVAKLQNCVKEEDLDGALNASSLSNNAVTELAALGYSEKKLAPWRKKIEAAKPDIQRMTALVVARGPKPDVAWTSGAAICLITAIKAGAYSPDDTEILAASPIEDIGGKWTQTVKLRGKNAFGMFVTNISEFHFKVSHKYPTQCEIVKERKL